MKGIGRSLYYWGYTLEKNFVILFGAMLTCLVFMGVMDEDGIMATITQVGPAYLVMIGLLFVFTQSLGNATSTFSLTLSMGGTRKTTFIAMIVMIHIVVFQLFGLGSLFAYLGAPDIIVLLQNLLPSILGIAFFAIGIGSGVTAIGMKLGQVWGVVSYLVAFVVCVFGGMMCISYIRTTEEMFALATGPVFLILGLAIDVFLCLIEYRIFRKYEVKV